MSIVVFISISGLVHDQVGVNLLLGLSTETVKYHFEVTNGWSGRNGGILKFPRCWLLNFGHAHSIQLWHHCEFFKCSFFPWSLWRRDPDVFSWLKNRSPPHSSLLLSFKAPNYREVLSVWTVHSCFVFFWHSLLINVICSCSSAQFLGCELLKYGGLKKKLRICLGKYELGKFQYHCFKAFKSWFDIIWLANIRLKLRLVNISRLGFTAWILNLLFMYYALSSRWGLKSKSVGQSTWSCLIILLIFFMAGAYNFQLIVPYGA